MCAFVKISQLPAVENVLPLTAGDIMPIVHGSTTYNVGLTTLQNYFNLNINLSAAGINGAVQFNGNSLLSADPGFVYLKSLSGLQIGNNNILTGIYSGILGGQRNTVSNSNTFAIGSNIQSNLNNYTLVNNISSMGLVADSVSDSTDWNSAFTWSNSQSARLSMPYLDTRYVNESGAFMSGDYTTTGSFSALSALYGAALQVTGQSILGGSLAQGNSTISSEASAVLIDLSKAGTYNLNLTGNVSTFSISNPVLAKFNTFTLYTIQDSSGGHRVTWSFNGTNVKWVSGSAPQVTQTANSIDIYLFNSNNGGTTWYGNILGQNYS